MDMITVSAKTLDEAITKALIELQTTSDNIEYEILEKGSSGFLGIGAKPVVIRAKVKESLEERLNVSFEKKTPVEQKKPAEKKIVEEKQAKAEKPNRPEKAERFEKPAKVTKPAEEEKQEQPVKSKKAVPEDADHLKAAADAFLKQVFTAMGMQVETEMSYDEKEAELSITLSGEDMGILIGKRGQTLDSLQYLVSLVVNREAEGYVRVKLDTENYRQRRKETLETLAKNISYKVKRTKRPVSLEPMNPYERRIIHSALQNDKYVVTRSEGEDPFRHVVISLKREGYRKDKEK